MSDHLEDTPYGHEGSRMTTAQIPSLQIEGAVLKTERQWTGTGGEEVVEILKVPTHTRVFVLIYLAKVPLVTNCSATPRRA